MKDYTINPKVTKLQVKAECPITLGAFIDELEGCDPTLPIMTQDGQTLGDTCSYRGYYSDLAFEPVEEPNTVADVLALANKSHGETFQGWKGGDFTMGTKTPVWVGTWGHSTGVGVVGVVQFEDVVIIVTEEVD